MTVNANEAGQGPNAVVTQPTAAEAAEAARLEAVQVAAQAGGPVRAYQPIAFTGVLPGAPQESRVATAFATVDPARGYEAADSLLRFLADPDRNLLELNGDKTLYAGITIVGEKLKVLYGFGYGTAPLGQTSPIHRKLLAMVGEGERPTALALDPAVSTAEEVIAFTEAKLLRKLTVAGRNFVALARAHEADPKVRIMKFAPIPAHLVLDGFEAELCPVDVYERLMAVTEVSAAVVHAQNYLRAAMITHRQADIKPSMDLLTFVPPPPAGAAAWAGNRIQELIPRVHPPAPVNPGVAQQGIPINQLQQLMEMFRQQHQPQPQQGGNGAQDQEEEKKEGTTTGLATFELEQTLTMCGLEPDEERFLPAWINKIQDKKLSDHSKSLLIDQALNSNTRFSDAEVQCTPELIKMIKTRDWMGGDNKRPLYAKAMKGLSPFAMLDLTEDEVANRMLADEVLNAATHTTAADYKSKSRIVATVPKEADEFLVMHKRYANLLFGLFGGSCPMFRHMVNIVENITSLSKSARDNMTQKSKSTMLWIILIQSREFARGSGCVVAEFRELIHALSVKRAEITHLELPAQLLMTDATKRKTDTAAPDATTRDESGKRPKVGKTTGAFNPILKPLVDAWAANGKPSLNMICKHCSVYPNRVTGDTANCRSHFALGHCSYGEICNKAHKVASDERATALLELLGKYVKAPEKLVPSQDRK